MESSSSRDEGLLIEIDTAEDWKRITNNFTDAINTVLDAELGKSASKTSRDALLQHLYQWRDEALEHAKSNTRINGVEPGQADDDEVMEPYDEALNFTVWGMDNERLAHDDDVSEKRRKIPQQIRDLTEGILSHERSTEFKVPERDANDELYTNVNSEPVLSNLEEIAQTHQETMTLSEYIRSRSPMLAGRAQRALEVVKQMSNLSS